MNDVQLSRKVTVLSFLAMVCVVTIHSQTVAALAHPAHWNVMLQRLLGGTLTCWAVPFFFMASGYFYRKTLARLPVERRWLTFVHKKTVGLLVPYVLWAVLGAILASPLILTANVVAHRSLFDNTVLTGGLNLNCLVSLLGIHGPPMGNFPLWYVRSLMLLFALTPVWLVLNRLPKWMRVVMALALSLFDSHLSVPYINLMFGSIGYFMIGSILSECKNGSLKVKRGVAVLAGLVAAIIAGVRMFDLLDASLFAHLYELMPYALIVFLWWLYDAIVGEREIRTDVLHQTFWIYCFHNAVVQIQPALLMSIAGKNDAVAFFAFIINPPLTVLVCLWVAKVVKRSMPRAYDVLVGGRN